MHDFIVTPFTFYALIFMAFMSGIQLTLAVGMLHQLWMMGKEDKEQRKQPGAATQPTAATPPEEPSV